MDTEEIKKRVDGVGQWLHKVEIAPGIVTPGRVDFPAKWKRLQMPESFKGKSVLDIGCNSGSFSFEAERLGADRVLAADIHPIEARGFKLLSEIKQSRVEYVQATVYELTPEKYGTFDFVFFLGLLYHLEHPLLGLQKTSAMCNESVIVETHVMESLSGEIAGESLDSVPIARFYPGNELNNDGSNWWGPNVACLREMMKVAGFKVQDIGYLPDQNRAGRAAFWGHK